MPEVKLAGSDLCGAMGRTPITGRFLKLVPGQQARKRFGRTPRIAAA
ncbi:hypothetical protein [Nonomuraea bangladeshensis]